MVLVQLEVPLPVVLDVCQKAYGLGKRVILNPAPAMDLPDNIFQFLRIDAVFRATYLNHPNVEKVGVRASINLSF